LSNDSNQTPDVENNAGHDHPEKNSLGWRVFFWISAVLMSLVLSFMSFELLSPFDWIDVLVSVIGTVGLYGFAYYRPVASVVFWRYFFYIVLIESLVYTFVLPVMGVEQYGQVVNFDGSFLLGVFYLGFYLAALNAYAYKRPFIWQRNK
jgi:hypothetical protein